MIGLVLGLVWWGVVLFAGVQVARAWGPGLGVAAVIAMAIVGAFGTIGAGLALVGALVAGYRAEEAQRPSLPPPGTR